MSGFETVSVTESYQRRCEDRVAVFETDGRTVIVVADGAGGSGAGAYAAETVIREVEMALPNADSVEDWTTVLAQIDCRIGDGESTAVIIQLGPERVVGASVGDSQTWIVRDGAIVDLTAKQQRKPLLGTGESRPAGFEYGRLPGLLVVATDGFCNYVKRQELPKVLPYIEFGEIPRRLVEMVRLPSRELWESLCVGQGGNRERVVVTSYWTNKRAYQTYEPADRCTAEIRQTNNEAIARIEAG